MSPNPGNIHRRPRYDSGAARLWLWARSRRSPWTTIEAAEAADLSPRRTRAVVRALHDAGYLDCVREAELADGMIAAEWSMSAAGRKLSAPPIMISDGAGNYSGVRVQDAAGNERLRRAIERSGLSGVAAAKALGIHARTLRALRAGEVVIAEDDPILERAASLPHRQAAEKSV